MLAYVLALVVGLGSFALYMAAFFFPEVHRKGDLIWSGVGLFYALVLWVCAGRITGGVLLGQIAGVSLLGWFGWQTLTLRRILTPTAQQTEVNPSDLQEKLNTLVNSESLSKLSEQASRQFGTVKDWTQAIASTLSQPKEKTPPPVQPYVPTVPPSFATSPKTESVEEADALEGMLPDEIAQPEATQAVPPSPPATDPWSNEVETGEEAASAADAETPIAPSVILNTVAQPAKANPLSTIVATIQSLFKSFNQPKNKTTYVRKEFRSEDEAAESPNGTIVQDSIVQDSIVQNSEDDWLEETIVEDPISVVETSVVSDEDLPLAAETAIDPEQTASFAPDTPEDWLKEDTPLETTLETLDNRTDSSIDLETTQPSTEASATSSDFPDLDLSLTDDTPLSEAPVEGDDTPSSLEFLLDNPGEIADSLDFSAETVETEVADEFDVLFAETDNLLETTTEAALEIEELAIDLDPNILITDSEAETDRTTNPASDPDKDG
jgi:hypothetical protein